MLFLITPVPILISLPIEAALPAVAAVYFLAVYLLDRPQYELTTHRWIETAGILKPKTRAADLGRVYHVVESSSGVSLGTDLDEFGADGINQPKELAELIRVQVRKRWEHVPRAQ
ncbi:MAG TPA: hypothetical protein VJU16_07805 [Planctomycetota bacterium]|nr:hypothetical protein [Planctomycetota bacterium]